MTTALPALGKIQLGKQLRSEQTLEAILDAAEQVISEKGYMAASVNEISRQAGVTIGAFYGRFEGKDALLRGLFDRLSLETVNVFEKLWGELAARKLSFRQALERSMEVMVWLYRDRAALIRSINQAAAANPTLRANMLAFNRDICSRLYRALGIYSRQITHPEPAMAMKLGHEAGMRLLRSSLLHQEIDYADLRAEGILVTDELLVREAARIWEAYLKCKPSFFS